MNQGVVHSSPVQQMVAAGSPNWWSINNTKPPPHHQHHSLPPHHHFPHPPLIGSSSSWENSQDLPESWSQLLQGGLVGEEDKTSEARKLENWEEQFLNHQSYSNSCGADVIKQENSYDYEDPTGNLEFPGVKLPTSSWSHDMISASSPKSCVTTMSTNMLDFSHKSSSGKLIRHRPDPSSHECNSTATGGAAKKARIQPTSAHSTFKVRKEKLGDRVTALHQLVSPFGKTDTASVLLEAIGYIRFLQSQIEALSVPYLGSGSTNLTHQHPATVQTERNSLFPEDPGQLLNNKKCIKRKGLTSEQQESCDDEVKEVPKKLADLRSRGLCLVPISCTLHVGSDNGADYWAPGNYF